RKKAKSEIGIDRNVGGKLARFEPQQLSYFDSQEFVEATICRPAQRGRQAMISPGIGEALEAGRNRGGHGLVSARDNSGKLHHKYASQFRRALVRPAWANSDPKDCGDGC